ncbi:hypothetical protein Ahy_B10g102685 isoform A [Arachis hypogaea]|uniref:Uncharacterized protein n=1 Tax=Arachis hypogaea TaxID=3818 RepID=A0A444X2C1_ARAHY|nr:hypothetical protein Ahy_B10g102685 isoform A [Arachis hypogaea]
MVQHGDVAGLSVADLLKKAWDSVDDAYETYRKYGRCHGFGVRKGDSGKDCDGKLVRYRFFCNREGLRETKHYNRIDRRRMHKPETRTGCQAKLSVYLDENENNWKIGCLHGIATSKILGYMAGVAGGYSLFGFLKKDAYNYADKARWAKIVDGDANAALVYLEGKDDSDSMSVARYNMIADERLGNLIWADGASRSDYQYFGNVLVFDSTYRKNKYKRPKPLVVIIDGDIAMIKAVKEVLPEAIHRLCAWHVERNVTSNMKDENLKVLFKRWLYSEMEIAEFEADWEDVLEEFGLKDSLWANQMHEKRKMWANAYLSDKFCAGFLTTSRCEGINAFVNKFSKSTHSILEMSQNLELAVREYRNKEILLQFNCIHTVPVMTTCLKSIESVAARVYTREVFSDVKKEIEKARAVNLVRKRRCLNTMVYTLEEYRKPNMLIIACFGRASRKLECQCNIWRKMGILVDTCSS